MKKIVKLNSIRTKILLVFIFFIAFSWILIGINNYFHYEKQSLAKKLSRLIEFESSVNMAMNYQGKVFLKDFTNEEFYTKNYTYNQLKYKEGIKKAGKLLKKFQNKAVKKIPVIQLYYTDSKSELKKVDYYFDKIIYLQKLRGFKNEGMEGRMRKLAHELENQLEGNQKTQLLQLRRHEKDFFLRGDTLYAEKLRLESNVLLQTLNPKHKNLLTKYITVFDSIKVIDNLTGVRTQYGYNSLLNLYSSQLHGSVKGLYDEYKIYHSQMIEKIDNLNIFAIFVLLIVSLLIGILLANSITVRIRTLSSFMNKYVESKFKLRSRFEPDFRNDEISKLIKNFEILENEITVQFEKYKYKVNLRTEEILKQKTEIEKQNSIIEQSNHELTQQKNILDFQHHHILESLKAAKELQRSFFPSRDKMNEILGDYHLRFEPLDIVSGDFYWIAENENGKYIAVADSTGHGAHGALMSINGIHLLNNAIRKLDLIHPHEILNYLSQSIHQQFNENGIVKHSIDIALIRIAGNKLYFAGAQRSIFLITSDGVKELKGDRKPLGYLTNGTLFSFSGQIMDVLHGDKILMFTDGLTDQFGGPELHRGGKKFKKNHLIELIERSSKFSSHELFDIINESFDLWKNNAEQTDDIILLVFEHGVNNLPYLNFATSNHSAKILRQ